MKNRDRYLNKKNEYDILIDIERTTHQCPIATVGGIKFRERFTRCLAYCRKGCKACVQNWLNEEAKR